MKLARRRSLITKMAKRLNEPAEDTAALSKDLLTMIDADNEGRTEYVVVLIEGRLVSTWGPYDTVKEAIKRCGDPIIASKPGQKGILTVLHRDFESISEGDDDGE